MTNQLPNDLITAFRQARSERDQARSERDQARKEAEELRDAMRVHIHEDYWPFTFSWEKEEKP